MSPPHPSARALELLERLAPLLARPRIVHRWSLADMERGAPRELPRWDAPLLTLAECIHTLDELGAAGPMLDALAEGAPRPYAHLRPVVAKMLVHGIVGSARGRPPRDLLAEAMQAPVDVPTVGEPHVEMGQELVIDGDGEAAWAPVELGYCRRSGMRTVWQCGDGHTGYRWVPCSRADCATCAELVAQRRQDRLAARFGGADVGHIVLTLPPVLVERVGAAQLPALRLLARDVVAGWFAVCDDVEVGQVIATHPDGDKSPGVWRPHFDICVPLVGLSRGAAWDDTQGGALVDRWALVDLQRMREPWELDLLRVMWAGACLRALRLAGVPAAERIHGVNAWWGFAAIDGPDGSPDKVAHRYRYSARPFPAWSAGKGWTSALSRARCYGLCSRPQARKGVEVPEVIAWRRRVRRELARPPVKCHCKGCELDAECIDVGDFYHIGRVWRWADDLDLLARPPPA